MAREHLARGESRGGVRTVKVAVLPRQGGKTTKLLQWMRDAPDGEHRVMLCHSSSEAMRLLRHSRDQDMGLESWQFVSSGDITDGAWSGVLRGRGGSIVVGIDNLDMFLQHIVGGWPVGAVTMTGDVW